MTERPVSHKLVMLRDGTPVTICLLGNECLSCDGACEGYANTEKRMRAKRAAYRGRKEKLRHEYDLRIAKRS